MNLVRNPDRTWAIVSDDDMVIVSGLPTATAVQRWATAALRDPEAVLRDLQAATKLRLFCHLVEQRGR